MATRNLHPNQFGGRVVAEVSRAGKPKKSYRSQAEAQAVADAHPKSYGTVATSYQGRDKQWYVSTDRRATADAKATEQIRKRTEAVVQATTPLVGSNIQTRQIVHTGTGATHLAKLSAMSPKSPMHGAWVNWVARHPLNNR